MVQHRQWSKVMNKILLISSLLLNIVAFSLMSPDHRDKYRNERPEIMAKKLKERESKRIAEDVKKNTEETNRKIEEDVKKSEESGKIENDKIYIEKTLPSLASLSGVIKTPTRNYIVLIKNWKTTQESFEPNIWRTSLVVLALPDMKRYRSQCVYGGKIRVDGKSILVDLTESNDEPHIGTLTEKHDCDLNESYKIGSMKIDMRDMNHIRPEFDNKDGVIDSDFFTVASKDLTKIVKPFLGRWEGRYNYANGAAPDINRFKLFFDQEILKVKLYKWNNDFNLEEHPLIGNVFVKNDNEVVLFGAGNINDIVFIKFNSNKKAVGQMYDTNFEIKKWDFKFLGN